MNSDEEGRRAFLHRSCLANAADSKLLNHSEQRAADELGSRLFPGDGIHLSGFSATVFHSPKSQLYGQESLFPANHFSKYKKIVVATGPTPFPPSPRLFFTSNFCYATKGAFIDETESCCLAGVWIDDRWLHQHK